MQRGYNASMLKLAVLVSFLAAQLIITWYGYFLGKVPSKGAIFGWHYDSPIVSLLVTLIIFIWVPLVINLLYGLGFQWGNASFRNFIVIITLWIASAPAAALIFNAVVTKERVDFPVILGMVFVVAGSVLVAAHKDIANLFR